jgi:hypothetical protein
LGLLEEKNVFYIETILVLHMNDKFKLPFFSCIKRVIYLLILEILSLLA